MKKLRIASMVSGSFTTPPPANIIYAPMDIAIRINEGLERRGHSITYFAPEGSHINVSRNESKGLVPLKQETKPKVLSGSHVRGSEEHKIYNLWDQYLIAQMVKGVLEGEFDIAHIHPADRALPIGLAASTAPIVYTLHDPIYQWKAEIFRLFNSPNQHYISISDAQRKPAPDLNYLATVYNGEPIEKMPFNDKPNDYLLFVGRLNPDKGVAEAVEIARETGKKLRILGAHKDQKYWDEKVAPYLGDKIQFTGMVTREELYTFYKNAYAVLFPIQWEEPFGLVMTESMGCGTPVIALNRGAVPEVIVDGKTGFVVDTIEEMIQALDKIDSIDRRACRKHVEDNFSAERMIEGYEQAFLSLIS